MTEYTDEQKKAGLEQLRKDFYFAFGIAPPKREMRDRCPQRHCSGKLRAATTEEIPERFSTQWKYNTVRCEKCNLTMHLTPHYMVGAEDVEADED